MNHFNNIPARAPRIGLFQVDGRPAPRNSLLGPGAGSHPNPDIHRPYQHRNPIGPSLVQRAVTATNIVRANSKTSAPSTSMPVIAATRNVRGPMVGAVTPMLKNVGR